MINLLKKRMPSPELWRYLTMAIILVGTEIVIFQTLIWTRVPYVWAVVLSMGIVIVLNWICSRTFVFKHRPHSAQREFWLVLAGSLVGVALQVSITAFVVEILTGAPLIGKLLAIIVTFFWNFWFRKRFVFYAPTTQT